MEEAPASVTYSVTSKSGFNALVTSRANTFQDLFKQMQTIEALLSQEGYIPQVKQVFGAKKPVTYIEGRVCPEDGGRLIDKTTNSGKKCEECENRKYDFKTKQTSGCSYIKWL